MNDVFGVRAVEGVGALNTQLDEGVGGQRAASDAVLERLALEELHDDVASLVFILANFVDSANVGMVQGGGGTGLAQEAVQRNFVSRNILGQEFQRHHATQGGIFGFINHAHPAAAELLNNTIARKSLAEDGVEFRHGSKGILGCV